VKAREERERESALEDQKNEKIEREEGELNSTQPVEPTRQGSSDRVNLEPPW